MSISPEWPTRNQKHWDEPLIDGLDEIVDAVNDLIYTVENLGGGSEGPPGEDGRGFSFKGAWNEELNYDELDVVSYAGSSWVAPDSISAYGIAPGESTFELEWHTGSAYPQGGFAGGISTGDTMPIAVGFVPDHDVVAHGIRFSWAANEGGIELRFASQITPSIVYTSDPIQINGPDYSGTPNEVVFETPIEFAYETQAYMVFSYPESGHYMQFNGIPLGSEFIGLLSPPESYNSENFSNLNSERTVWFEFSEEVSQESPWELLAAKGDSFLPSGSTSGRPEDVVVGSSYFDETLGKPIWVKSIDPIVWVDASGSTA